MILHCELCAGEEHLKFKFATKTLFEEHLSLVHNIQLGEDGRSVKTSSQPVEKPENPVVQIPPRR